MKSTLFFTLLYVLGTGFLNEVRAQVHHEDHAQEELKQSDSLTPYEQDDNLLLLMRYYIGALKSEPENLNNQKQALFIYNSLMRTSGKQPVESWRNIDQEWVADQELSVFNAKERNFIDSYEAKPAKEKYGEYWGGAVMLRRTRSLLQHLNALDENPHSIYDQRQAVLLFNLMAYLKPTFFGKLATSWEEIDRHKVIDYELALESQLHPEEVTDPVLAKEELLRKYYTMLAAATLVAMWSGYFLFCRK